MNQLKPETGIPLRFSIKSSRSSLAELPCTGRPGMRAFRSWRSCLKPERTRTRGSTERRGSGSNTPLHEAASHKNPAFVAALLEAGADPNARGSFGDRPLHDAAGNRNPAIAATLLKAGADPNARGQLDKTPLEVALNRNNRAVADLLLKGHGPAKAGSRAGADPVARNKDGETSLHRMAKNGSASAIAALLKLGADPNSRDKRGWTPLHLAVSQNKRPGVIAELLKGGANPNAGDRSGWTPLHMAASGNKKPGVITELLKGGANPNAGDRSGWTPLHMAASGNKKPGVITELLKGGANPNARNKTGGTPLHNAASGSRDPAVIDTLIRAGSDPNARDQEGYVPLHSAPGNKNPAVTKALLKAGANPNAQNKYGGTPLHRAVGIGDPATIAVLLGAGADPNISDKYDDTPVDKALAKNDPALVAAFPRRLVADAKREASRQQDTVRGSAAQSASPSTAGGCADGPICLATVKNAQVVLDRVGELQATKNLDITDNSLAVAFTTRASIACMKACLEREETRTDCRNGLQQAVGELGTNLPVCNPKCSTGLARRQLRGSVRSKPPELSVREEILQPYPWKSRHMRFQVGGRSATSCFGLHFVGRRCCAYRGHKQRVSWLWLHPDGGGGEGDLPKQPKRI